MALDQLDLHLRASPDVLTREEAVELRNLVEDRYAKRLAMLGQGISLWDYRISIVLIVSGRAG